MKASTWATLNECESPFWREDMTQEEYETERTYWLAHFQDLMNGTYVPLWKQKKAISKPPCPVQSGFFMPAI